jgi:hypothetical protein
VRSVIGLPATTAATFSDAPPVVLKPIAPPALAPAFSHSFWSTTALLESSPTSESAPSAAAISDVDICAVLVEGPSGGWVVVGARRGNKIRVSDAATISTTPPRFLTACYPYRSFKVPTRLHSPARVSTSHT